MTGQPKKLHLLSINFMKLFSVTVNLTQDNSLKLN